MNQRYHRNLRHGDGTILIRSEIVFFFSCSATWSDIRASFRIRGMQTCRSNENLNVPTMPHHPPKSQSISPLAMDRQNGFANGMKEECKVETYVESRSSIGMVSQGYSEVDKASFPDLSPIRMSIPASKRSPELSPMTSCGQQNKSGGMSFSSPKQGVVNRKRNFRRASNSLPCPPPRRRTLS